MALHDVLERLANCYEHLGDMESRFNTQYRAHTLKPLCDQCLRALVAHYGRNNEHEAPSHAVRIISSILWQAQHYGNTVSTSWAAAKAARKRMYTVQAIYLELALGKIYSEFSGDPATAMKLWERIPSTSAMVNDDTHVGMVRAEASSKLARQLLCDTLDGGIETPKAKLAAEKLEILAEQRISDPDSVRAISLGVYHRLNRQEAKA
ncbi:hypothetical protein BDW68DRAFT_180988 [Aspergillus falconensis]